MSHTQRAKGRGEYILKEKIRREEERGKSSWHSSEEGWEYVGRRNPTCLIVGGGLWLCVSVVLWYVSLDC